MKNTYIAPRSMSSDLGPILFFTLFFLMLSGFVGAQATQDFSATPVGTNAYVDMGSGTVQHLLVNNMAPQTAPNAATSGASLGYQVLFTPTRVPSIGLTDGELFGAVDVTVPSSTDNDMGSLAIDFVANPPTGGNNNVYIMDDPDGLTTLRFNPVVVGAGSMFSMNYIIHNTSYENTDGVDDRVEIYLVNMADGQRTSLLSATNDQMENSEIWQDLTADLTALEGQTMQLVVEFDVNSSSEEMAIDNISFSSGTVMPDWPVCVEPNVPVVDQFPASVCPGLPFRLLIQGSLNNASHWAIYGDATGTDLIATTSGNSYDFYSAVPGTNYFVRGEGECVTPGDFFGITLATSAAGDCMPNATPGTSFEEPLGSSEDYVDIGDPSATHDLINNQGQPAVAHTFKAQELGFTTRFFPSRSGTSGEAGLTDGDAVGVSNDSDFAFPDGNQGLVLEDTDGTVFVSTTPVDVTGLTNVMVSFDYFVNSTSYEVSGTGADLFAVGIFRGSIPLESVIDSRGDGSTGLPGLETGVWTTVTYEITGTYITPIQLVFQADFDAGTERVLIDNVSFSAGTVICEDTDDPVVVCPEPVMVEGDENCMSVATFEASATDDCSSNVMITYSQDSGTTFPVGENAVMVTATDESGKSSTCTFTVTVNDVTPPTITCQDFTVQLDSMDNCTYIFTDTSFDPVATDNCGNVSIFSADIFGDGSTLNGQFANISSDGFGILWRATDETGLTATCVSTFTVINPPNCFPTSVTSQDPSDFSAVRATPNPFTAGTT
ncbi:MAG: HYR domain-containing protein, partial [Lewinella sp.]